MDKQETARDLRKKLKRANESRDLQMTKNQEKSIELKALRGKIDDLEESRSNLRNKYDAAKVSCVDLDRNLKIKDKELREKNQCIEELNEIILKKEKMIAEERLRREKAEEKSLEQIEELKKRYFNLSG